MSQNQHTLFLDTVGMYACRVTQLETNLKILMGAVATGRLNSLD